MGRIALDLAPRIAPGRVVGVDIDAGVGAARRSAIEREITNVAFDAGSVCELPFGDESFDVVYSNAVLMFVGERQRALAEMRASSAPEG